MRSAARPYADALYSVADREGSIDATLSALEAVQGAVGEVPLARLLLEQPDVAHEAAQRVLRDIVDACPPLAGRFVQLLFDRRRVAMLGEVIAAYRDRVDERRGVVRGRLESARAVPTDVAGEVRAALDRRTGKDVVLTESLRPELIGGLRVVLGDRILDVSVAGRLDALRRQLRAGAPG
jgi:F-type H+-transporting ATPase subunit delta